MSPSITRRRALAFVLALAIAASGLILATPKPAAAAWGAYRCGGATYTMYPGTAAAIDACVRLDSATAQVQNRTAAKFIKTTSANLANSGYGGTFRQLGAWEVGSSLTYNSNTIPSAYSEGQYGNDYRSLFASTWTGTSSAKYVYATAGWCYCTWYGHGSVRMSVHDGMPIPTVYYDVTKKYTKQY